MIQFPQPDIWFSIITALNVVVWISSTLLIKRKLNFNSNEVIGFLFMFNIVLLVTSIARDQYSNSGKWFWLTLLVILVSNILAIILRGKLNDKSQT
jgi:hypothetical protein